MVTIRYRHGKGTALERCSTEIRPPLEKSDGGAQYVSERPEQI
jgi:hypothetical protein